MSQTQQLFAAGTKLTTITASTSPTAPTPKQLASPGDTARIVNLSATDAAYVAFGATSATAIAALPTDGAANCCYVSPGADFTVSIPNTPGAAQFASAIAASGAPSLLIYVGWGS